MASGALCLLALGWNSFWDWYGICFAAAFTYEWGICRTDTRSGSPNSMFIIQSALPSRLGQVTSINIARFNVSWQKHFQIETFGSASLQSLWKSLYLHYCHTWSICDIRASRLCCWAILIRTAYRLNVLQPICVCSLNFIHYLELKWCSPPWCPQEKTPQKCPLGAPMVDKTW